MKTRHVVLTEAQVADLSRRLGKGPRLLPSLVREEPRGLRWMALGTSLRIGDLPGTFILEGENELFTATAQYVTGKSQDELIKNTLAYRLQWVEDDGRVIWAAPQEVPIEYIAQLFGGEDRLRARFGDEPRLGQVHRVRMICRKGGRRRYVPIQLIWESDYRMSLRAPLQESHLVMARIHIGWGD